MALRGNVVGEREIEYVKRRGRIDANKVEWKVKKVLILWLG